MPRHSLSQNQNGQNALLVQNMLRKQEEYKDAIRDHHEFSKVAAGRVRVGGEIEELVGGGEEDFEEYRNRLKALTENNIQQERQLMAFLNALEELGNQDDVDDYQSRVDSLMNRSLEQIARQAGNIQQENMYIEICTKLGEKPNAAAAAGGVGDDDELEIMESAPSRATLKCPITCGYFVNPVKHQVCGHVFSREAITAHLQKDKRCPVAGCSQQSININQFKPDKESEILVKRAKRQSEIHQQTLSQQAVDLDDEEEEF